MNKLSVIVITLNEEHNLKRCLDSVSFVDEIIVVDSGSTDKTVEIAKQFGANVFQRGWPGDGPQKHFGVEKANNDWCLILDADEEISPELKHAIQHILQSPKCSVYKMHRRSYFLNKVMKHGDWGRDWIVRLFDSSQHEWTKDKVHSKLNISKRKAFKLDGKLIHYTQGCVSTSLDKMNAYSDIASKHLIDNNKTQSFGNALIHYWWTFFRGYILKAGFLDGRHGLLLAQLSALGSYMKYIKVVFHKDGGSK